MSVSKPVDKEDDLYITIRDFIREVCPTSGRSDQEDNTGVGIPHYHFRVELNPFINDF